MTKCKGILVAMVAVALGGAVKDANAALTQSGMAGHGWPNHFDSCFGSSWALMVNNCPGSVGASRLLIIPIQVPAPGTYFFVGARTGGNGFNGGTRCQGISLTGQNNAWGFTAIVSSSTSAASQYLNLGGLPVPAGGTAHFECEVAQGGGRVYNVEMG